MPKRAEMTAISAISLQLKINVYSYTFTSSCVKTIHAELSPNISIILLKLKSKAMQEIDFYRLIVSFEIII